MIIIIQILLKKKIQIQQIYLNKYKSKGDERKEIYNYTYTDENGYLNTNKNPFNIASGKYSNIKFKKEPILYKYESSQKEKNIKNENNLNKQNEDNFSKEDKKEITHFKGKPPKHANKSTKFLINKNDITRKNIII